MVFAGAALKFTMVIALSWMQLQQALSPAPIIIRDCGAIPELNREIVNFVRGKLNQRVGRGECWDLAAEALNHAGAAWDKRYGFGREVNPGRECVFPGDIMQFEGVTVKYQKGGYFYEEMMTRHTAVVFEVKDDASFLMAEQNTSAGGKKVTLNPLELKNIVKGKYRIYRPLNE
jgi:hypothetical protein